jgi:hypothetical protein
MRPLVMSLLALLAVGSCPSAVAQRAGAVGDRSWVDASYEYVTNQTDTLAQQLDSFFGEADAERESADSVLRLQSEYQPTRPSIFAPACAIATSSLSMIGCGSGLRSAFT